MSVSSKPTLTLASRGVHVSFGANPKVAVVAGVAAGVGLLLLVGIGLMLRMAWKRRQQRRHRVQVPTQEQDNM